MTDMAKTCDDFGALLLRLRSERGLSSRALGRSIGKSENYIGGWEAYARPINKSVLHQVCAALELNDPERHQLFRLADQRNLPDDAPRSWTTAEQIQLNLHHALSEVHHELPEGISSEVMEFGDAAGWLLAWYAAGGVEGLEFSDLKWPAFFARNKIITSKVTFHPERVGTVDIPEAILTKELPDLSAIDRMDEVIAHRLGLGMATVYRQWLLGDLDRCRAAVRGLKRWSLTDEPGRGLVASFVFGDVDANDIFGVDEVACKTVAEVAQREAAYYLWETYNKRPSNNLKHYPGHVQDCDHHVLVSLTMAKAYLGQTGKTLHKWQQQQIQDALYIVKAPAWHCPPIDVEMFTLHQMMIGELEATEPTSEDDLVREIERTRKAMIRTLTDAVLSFRNGTTPARPPRQSASPKKAKRKARNASRSARKCTKRKRK